MEHVDTMYSHITPGLMTLTGRLSVRTLIIQQLSRYSIGFASRLNLRMEARSRAWKLPRLL